MVRDDGMQEYRCDSFRVGDHPDRTRAVSAFGIVFSKPTFDDASKTTGFATVL